MGSRRANHSSGRGAAAREAAMAATMTVRVWERIAQRARGRGLGKSASHPSPQGMHASRAAFGTRAYIEPRFELWTAIALACGGMRACERMDQKDCGGDEGDGHAEANERQRDAGDADAWCMA